MIIKTFCADVICCVTKLCLFLLSFCKRFLKIFSYRFQKFRLFRLVHCCDRFHLIDLTQKAGQPSMVQIAIANCICDVSDSTICKLQKLFFDSRIGRYSYYITGSIAQLLVERLVSDREVADSQFDSRIGNASLCHWGRHF